MKKGVSPFTLTCASTAESQGNGGILVITVNNSSSFLIANFDWRSEITCTDPTYILIHINIKITNEVSQSQYDT